MLLVRWLNGLLETLFSLVTGYDESFMLWCKPHVFFAKKEDE